VRIITDKGILSQVSKECTGTTPIKIVLTEMRLHINKGVGLAAIQLGHPYRVIMINTEHTKITVINPVITVVGKATRTGSEGCLSVPGKQVRKVRHYCIILTGFDEQWNPIKRKMKGFDARVAQHEVDHLNGVTI